MAGEARVEYDLAGVTEELGLIGVLCDPGRLKLNEAPLSFGNRSCRALSPSESVNSASVSLSWSTGAFPLPLFVLGTANAGAGIGSGVVVVLSNAALILANRLARFAGVVLGGDLGSGTTLLGGVDDGI